ncbi:TonB-dependent receptor [Sphingomonas turrisvirgatae]|uniref:TonB-dependent receptor n=1 Tax=Sphingomonas turrisvirgatae TaxID=1888892 RepID=A0A1E3LWC1_9SPHN|nr:TonB-dependent receptor [Sphingomonas turrisvirgatae]ODP37090.1 TonB-dependent receptor [Sphingomonas turrisvirgatae]
MSSLEQRSVPAYLGLAAIGFIASAPALANDGKDGVAEPGQIVVTGQKEGEVESPKATAPLLDTPQTVTVVSDQVIRKQNLQTLRDALQTIPGITFGAGEGGGGYGDSINLRGYSANNDLTIDGVRDSAQYTRTDPFNLQQIEVYNGSNSVFNGSGSVGGTINLVTKAPQADSLTIVQGSVGTDDYWRGAIDANQRVSDLIAVRLNAAYHRNDVPGRDVEKYERWGVAPSITIGIDGPTRLTLSYVHQEDRNTPIFGVPYFQSLVNAGPLPDVDPGDYFGIANLDRQDTTIDRLTAIFTHQFSEALSVRHLSRWQRVEQDSVTSAPQGTFCLASTGRQPVGATGAATQGLACPAGLLPGQYQPSGPRGLVRDQENQLLHHQTDFRFVAGEKGGLRNTLVVGGAVTIEDYALTQASLPRTAAGAAVTLPAISIANPDTVYAGPVNYTVTSQARSSMRNLAIYAFDTLELGAFELNGGVRWENNRGRFRNLPLAVYPPGTTPLTAAQLAVQTSDEDLFSYRIGAVFKPVETVSLYAAYGNALTPSSATVRLGCGVIAAPGAADPCAVAPEKARTYEIGAKADLFGRRLQLTAAVFRNERSNFRVPSNDPSQPSALQVLDGRARVDGFSLGASGNITPAWTIFANYTYLDSEVLQSVSDFCLATPGGSGCGNSTAMRDVQAGQEMLQTPRHSGSLFTTVKLPFGLEIGYGLTYQGDFALNNRVLGPTGVVTPQFRADDYLIHRAFLSYPITPGLTAQINIQNLTDELYYTGVRNNVNATTGAISGGWATPGDRRSAVFSLFYSF